LAQRSGTYTRHPVRNRYELKKGNMGKEIVMVTRLLNCIADYRIIIGSVLDNYETTILEITQSELDELADKIELYRKIDLQTK